MSDFPPSPDFPFAIVGFDLDGTLVDSARDLGPAINHALASVDRPPVPTDKTKDLIGGGTALMLERALDLTGGPLPPDRFEAMLAVLLAHYEEHIAERTVPYEGCLEALDALAARGVKLAVVTNKLEHPARKLLGELGMADHFASIMGGDSLGPGRAKPKRDMIDETIVRCGGLPGGARFAMVGDSTYDVGAARNAGVPVVTLSFGYADVPLDQLGGDVLIDHFNELVGALERL
jgi:phosphoglycolate phosphatase